MKKHGFTLVELLAVIAILSILAIISIPNIMSLFNEAKKNSFTNELKNIYKTANSKWISDSMFDTNERKYARVSGSNCSSQLSLSGREELNYFIKLNKNGKVVEFYAEDGSYQYSYKGNGLNIEDISDVVQIANITNNRTVTITCNSGKVSSPPPASTNDYLKRGDTGNENSNFLRTSIAKKDIEKITFTDTIEGHSTTDSNTWDVSYGNNGSVLAWSVDSDNNGLYELTIGANGDVYAYSGYYLFYKLINLKTFSGMEYLNTSQATDMYGMFEECFSLTSLDLSSFDTSKITKMGSMFERCTNLTSLDLSSFDTSNVTNMSDMFLACKNLTSLDVSHFNTSKVTDMRSMFSNCLQLTSLDVSHFDTSNVIYMQVLFGNCRSLTSIDVSNFNTSKVIDMNGMFGSGSNAFSDQMNLTEIIGLDKFNTSNVTDMGYMFHNCRNLTSINVSSFETSKVTNMRGMFTNLTVASIDLSNFNTSNVTNMELMFEGLNKITSLDLSSFNTSKVTSMSRMISSCSNLKTIYASNNFNTSLVTNSSSMFSNSSKLVGGSGTTYNSSHIDKEYARIDGGTSSPGYFTLKTN